MAKSKQKAVKTPKKRSTKYGKLAVVAAKELAAKKAALVRAEKALAKAQKQHTELLSEVARLDMLDRSLKALINGTEPPQNVRYVYTYPQWVWQGNPYGWWWNGSTYVYNTVPQYNYTTCGSNSQLTGGQFNVNTVQGIGYGDQISTAVGDAPAFTTTSSSIPTSGTITCNASSGLIGNNSSGISLSNSAPSSFTFTNATPLQSVTTSTADLTVDLSTGAEEEPKEVIEAELDGEVTVTAKVGHGG